MIDIPQAPYFTANAMSSAILDGSISLDFLERALSHLVQSEVKDTQAADILADVLKSMADTTVLLLYL